MNAQEKLRRRRKKIFYRKLKALIPVIFIILMISGLTVGGIILSLKQTRQTNGTEQSKNPDTNASNVGNNEMTGTKEADSQEAETIDEALLTEDERFDRYASDLLKQVNAQTILMDDAVSGKEAFDALKQFDKTELSDENQARYDVLYDTFTVTEEGAAYTVEVPKAQSFASVEGGTELYAYLLKKISGTDFTMEEIHNLIANEFNVATASLGAIQTASPNIEAESSTKVKSGAVSEYLYGTVTAESDELMKKVAENGLSLGWSEFGLIRAYQLDDTLDEATKNFLIGKTRRFYAFYGLLDLYIHYNGMSKEDIFTFGKTQFPADTDEFFEKIYQNILENPGQYAACVLGYIELVQIEAGLQQKVVNGYSDDTLVSFLFEKGPASFRVYRKWLESYVQ